MTKKTTRVRKNRVGVGSGLGELEADIMSVVWNIGSASVKDVFEELYPDKRLAYTTIMTVMSRLANKGVLKQDRSGTAYLYTPNVSQDDMAQVMINQVVDKVLGGNPVPALMFLLKKTTLTDVEIDRFLESLEQTNGELVNS
ncbi:MAG TPA: BlaI/MecI/CopY family transcriptional regulator [Candidatus Aquicultor sp.]|jgi:predicted transcriptional regulator